MSRIITGTASLPRAISQPSWLISLRSSPESFRNNSCDSRLKVVLNKSPLCNTETNCHCWASEDIWRNGPILHEETIKADTKTKDQGKQQGKFCLLAKSKTANSKAESLLCQIQDRNWSCVHAPQCFTSVSLGFGWCNPFVRRHLRPLSTLLTMTIVFSAILTFFCRAMKWLHFSV